MLALLQVPSAGASSVVVPPDALRDVDLSRSLVALVAFATTPGITNASYTIDWPDDQPEADLDKSAITIEPKFNLQGRSFRIFTGFAVSRIKLNDRLNATNEDGEAVSLDPERDLLSIRGSAGLEFRLSTHWIFTPYASFIYSDMDSTTTVRGNVDTKTSDPNLQGYLVNWSTKSYSLAGTLKLKYDRWFERKRLELQGLYTYTYVDTFDESADFVESSGGINSINLEARFSAPTGLQLKGIPIRWQVYGAYTDFLDLRKDDLGFTHYFELGGGFDFEVDVQALAIFNLRNIGLEVAGIKGDDIKGWRLSIIVRN